MNIGEKIKELRVRRRMTQADLAGDTVSRNMVSLIENGRATPSVQTLEEIAAKLKVTPSFLMADKREQGILLKQEALSNIRIAFTGKNYRICADLCQSLYKNGMEPDDEVDLVLSESLLALAKEEFLFDHIRECCRLLDDAVLYAERTVYYTEHILSTAWWYFEYLGLLSPTLTSENLNASVEAHEPPRRDVYCRYIEAILAEDSENMPQYTEDPAIVELLATHVRARACMREDAFEKAHLLLSGILRSPDSLPGIVTYHLLHDIEKCCRALGNTKNEANYREARLSMFEKLLS